MADRQKKRTSKQELYVSWMLGFLVLLIGNATIFKRYGASVGDPWFNLILSGAILFMLIRIALDFVNGQKTKKRTKSNIDKIDGMSEEDFACYIARYFARDGWTAESTVPKTAGTELLLRKEARSVRAILRKSRRKLTHEYIRQVFQETAAYAGSGEETWIITNGAFTSQAARAAANRGIKLWDRRILIDKLAKIEAVRTLRPLEERAQ